MEFEWSFLVKKYLKFIFIIINNNNNDNLSVIHISPLPPHSLTQHLGSAAAAEYPSPWFSLSDM